MKHNISSLGGWGERFGWVVVALGVAALGAVACGSDDEDSGSGGSGATGGSGGATGGSGGSTGGSGGDTGGSGGATGGSGGSTGGSGGATGGSGGSTGGSGGATGGSGGSTGGSGGTGGSSDPGFVIGLDGIGAFDAMSSADQDALKNTKVFFQHMSVGDNWDPPWNGGTNSLGFVFDSVDSASDYGSATLGENAFGYNGDPFDKLEGFQEHVLNMGIGGAVKVAGFKYCYNDLTVDITATGDDVISAYQSTYQEIESGTSGVSFFHVTTPLQPADEWQTVENNTLRVKFADFLRSTYAGGRHVVFDLQEIESTKANGETCSQSGVPVLCNEWAADNDGHLNDAGATRAAKAFLYALHVARGL
jgi:hypothetical protein